MVIIRCAGLLGKLDSAVSDGQSDDDVTTRLALPGDVFLPKSRALAYLRSSKRAVYDYDDGWNDGMGGTGQRGLACECCVHMCSYDEMTEYCHPPLIRKRLAISADTHGHTSD